MRSPFSFSRHAAASRDGQGQAKLAHASKRTMAQESKASVIGAVAANFVITAAKLVAAIVGKSTAMLSESIHSAVDGVNDLLLLFGLERSKKPPDELHPFGYGKELYFWSLIVSCSVLSIGGGVTIMEGVRSVLHPEKIQHVGWSYGALACGALFEAASFVFSLKQFRKQRPRCALYEAIQSSKDPSSFMVMLEDAAAFIGEVIAAIGVYLSTRGMDWADGAASILIGILLSVIAIFVIGETRHLIVGEAADKDIQKSIRDISTREEDFGVVRSAKTIHFGADTVLLALELDFDPNRSAHELMESIDELQQAVRDKHPDVKFVYVDATMTR